MGKGIKRADNCTIAIKAAVNKSQNQWVSHSLSKPIASFLLLRRLGETNVSKPSVPIRPCCVGLMAAIFPFTGNARGSGIHGTPID